MMKVVGFIEMKKKTGVIVFVEQDGIDNVHGKSTDKLFIYEDLAKKITDNVIGHEISVAYGCGYSGKAYISDITIK